MTGQDNRASNLRWLDELPNGWHVLYRALIADLPAEIIVGQAKEKFGGLRVYLDNASSLSESDCARTEALIDAAEAASFKICQDCGAQGQVRKRGWFATLCDEHGKGYELSRPI